MSNGIDLQGGSRPYLCRTGSTFKVARGRIDVERDRPSRWLATALISNGIHLEGGWRPPSCRMGSICKVVCGRLKIKRRSIQSVRNADDSGGREGRRQLGNSLFHMIVPRSPRVRSLYNFGEILSSGPGCGDFSSKSGAELENVAANCSRTIVESL